MRVLRISIVGYTVDTITNLLEIKLSINLKDLLFRTNLSLLCTKKTNFSRFQSYNEFFIGTPFRNRVDPSFNNSNDFLFRSNNLNCAMIALYVIQSYNYDFCIHDIPCSNCIADYHEFFLVYFTFFINLIFN